MAKPTVIIKNGKLDPEACRSKDFLLQTLPWNCVQNFPIKGVKRAVIEQNGQMIVVRAGGDEKASNTQSLRMVWFSLKFWNNWESEECW